jgi:hypothetical protein
MVTIACFRLWLVLSLLPAFVLVHPSSAHATRVDIDDPSLLGPVVLSNVIYDANPYERAVAEVRYKGGIYSYVYAVSGSPYFPGTSCCEASMVSFAVTGHPLEDTWGAINSSDLFWAADNPDRPLGTTAHVSSILPIFDGFRVVSQPGTGRFAVVYMQSPLPPSGHGILTYTGRVRDFDHDPGGIVRIESFQKDDVLVPVPEPGSFVLFGLGLASLAAKRRAVRRARCSF